MVDTVFPAVAACTKEYNVKMQEQFAKAYCIVDEFPKGSYVYRVDVDNKKKAHPKFSGPYCVVTALPDSGYLLSDYLSGHQHLPKNSLSPGNVST